MKKSVLLSAAAIALLGAASCTRYIYVSRCSYQEAPVTVDGNAGEWPEPLKYYDDKSKLQYAVTNDDHNLYICIKATEDETQTKIFRSGLQIWIDTTGNNEHQVGITFPLPSDIRRGDQDADTRRTIQKSDGAAHGKKRFFNDFIEMNLTGFKPPVGGMTSVQNNFGITASLNKDSLGIMTYEAVIPFRTFYREALTAADSLKLMGISIVLKAVPTDEASQSSGRHGGGDDSGAGMGGGGMRGGGMGGMGGGGMHGGGMHGGGGGGHHGGAGSYAGSEYLHETNSVKKIFQLALKKK